MPRPVSNDLRARIVRAVEGGASRNATAKRFSVSVSTVVKLMQAFRATGSHEPKRMGGYRKAILAGFKDKVVALVAAMLDATLDELVRQLKAARIAVGRSTLARYLNWIGFRFKKTLHASEQDRPDVKAAREVLRSEQQSLDASRLVFVDETGFATNMVRRYGRCPSGQRLLGKAPYGHWRTTTFVAALRRNGLSAPLALDGPMNGETFCAWIGQFLVPTLKRGEIVFMGNLPSHKVKGIGEAIEAAGARLRYLPPHSPDLNPIKQVFAKFKALLRKAKVRTVTRLWREIAKALKTFTAEECAAYLAHCGYAN